MNEMRRLQWKSVCDSASDRPNDSASDCPNKSGSYNVEAPPEKVLSDIMIFEEESDEDCEISINDDQISDNESTENKRLEETTAGSATHYVNPFQSRLRKRNILTQRARIDATPDFNIHSSCFTVQLLFSLQSARQTEKQET